MKNLMCMMVIACLTTLSAFAIEWAGTPYVDLDASDGVAADLSSWSNRVTNPAVGSFSVRGVPVLTTIASVTAVQFNGSGAAFVSSGNAPLSICQNSPVSIEAWVHNAVVAGEDTIVSWSKRGGPVGSNMTFNYGTVAEHGAVGHWGWPDLGWGIEGAPQGDQWHHLVYVFNGERQTVYADGVYKNHENLTLMVHTNLPINIAVQRAADTNYLETYGSLSIARLRVHDGILNCDQVRANYNEEATDFGRNEVAAPSAYVNLDAADFETGMSIWTNRAVNPAIGHFNMQGTPFKTNINGVAALWFKGATDAGVSQNNTPPDGDLTGNNPVTIKVWAFNTDIPDEETILSWGHRGVATRNMSFNWGSSGDYGAVTHYGPTDLGWGIVPPTNEWHQLVYTFDGSTQRVFCDGYPRASEAVSLNIFHDDKINLAAQQWGGGLNYISSLAIAKVEIYGQATRPIDVALQFAPGASAAFSAAAPAGVLSNNAGCAIKTDAVEGGWDNANYVAGNQSAQGQTFTTGHDGGGYLLKSISLQHAPIGEMWWNTDSGVFHLRVTKPAGTDIEVLGEYNIEVTQEMPHNFGNGVVKNGTGRWITFTLETPLPLDKRTLYGFDLSIIQGFSSDANGPYFMLNGNGNAESYTGGWAYTTGAAGKPGSTLTQRVGDHVFVLDMEILPSMGTIILVY